MDLSDNVELGWSLDGMESIFERAFLSVIRLSFQPQDSVGCGQIIPSGMGVRCDGQSVLSWGYGVTDRAYCHGGTV